MEPIITGHCNCENSECEACGGTAECRNGASVWCAYIGQLCARCATYMPAEYLDRSNFYDAEGVLL